MSIKLADTLIEQFVSEETLPDSFVSDVDQYLLPLAEMMLLDFKAHHQSATWYVGVQGAQGSGKSTLAKFLQRVFQSQDIHTVILSIDDFYLTKLRRAELSKSIHPLLAIRGVPGTHDLELAQTTLQALSEKQVVLLPSFNKSIDDQRLQSEWRSFQGPAEIVILEGWCVGLQPLDGSLDKAVNTLELQEDSYGDWRSYYQTQLNGPYQSLFSMLQSMVVLQAPSFECVYEWRLKQETKLLEKCVKESLPVDNIMSEAEINRFVQHYERLTLHALNTMKAKADWVLELNSKHRFIDLYSPKN